MINSTPSTTPTTNEETLLIPEENDAQSFYYTPPNRCSENAVHFVAWAGPIVCVLFGGALLMAVIAMRQQKGEGSTSGTPSPALTSDASTLVNAGWNLLITAGACVLQEPKLLSFFFSKEQDKEQVITSAKEIQQFKQDSYKM